jgi:LysM repeat protein
MRFFIAIFCIITSFYTTASASIDSIGVENNNGKQLILHKVQPKETYYSIGRLYNVSPRSIIEQNNNIPLQIGIVLKVPTNRPFSRTVASTTKTIQPVAPASDIVEYKVGPKEYLYSIAKRFNTTIEDIKALNNLRGNNLSIGQIIKVRPGRTDSTPAATPITPAQNPIPAVNTDTPVVPVEKPKIATGRLGVSERTEKGVAVWIADENLDGTKMLALHRTAPIGTVVKITNPMTDRVTFVKVVGKYTENATTQDVIIVITKATADLLGALDKRFQVTIDYGIPNE